MPTTPRVGDLEFSDLDAVPRELDCLSESLPDVGMTVLCSPTRDELDNGVADRDAVQPTGERVLRELAAHSCVHFACHGGQDLLNPSHGGVFLADGPLTVLQLSAERARCGARHPRRPDLWAPYLHIGP